MKTTLNGEWLFKTTAESEWMHATVPGCNYLDLMNLGKISDPFEGTNEKDVYWVALADWEYKKEFRISEPDFHFERISLVCEMLDTICDIYINDLLIGKGENTHVKYSFDVKSVLRIGVNSIRIVFYSPVRYVEKKQSIEKCPKNWNGQDGIPHIRKPQCHFGWDWGPVLPPSGITKNIYLEFKNTAKIEETRITQTHTGGAVTLAFSAAIDNFHGVELDYEIIVTAPGNSSLKKTGKCTTVLDETIVVENPELWWTNDLSDKKEQPLYSVCIAIKKDGETIDEEEKEIGLRTLILNREKDQYGSNFQFVLNGVPLFIKGANWIPADSFINRFDNEKLAYLINAALFSNMNMLRIWGGGYYGNDEMYSLCDRKGILLWQDFMFACQPYPFFDDEFLANVKRETEDNVKRLRHHASLAVWCGNNEIEAMSIGWPFSTKFIEWTEKFFYHILEPEIRQYDTVTPYIPGSPCGVSYKAGYDKDNVGDTHLWAVWHGLQPMNYYRKRMTRFCSEFGFESLPDIKTIRRFAKPDDYSLTSDVFESHQKCRSGNMKMVYYIATRFRLPKRFVDFIYLSQVAQQECVADATEHWRRNKGRCNGSLFWQLNDCWPVCSWASIDYYGNYKALQYTSRHFNAPVSVSVEDNTDRIRIFILNDKNHDIAVTVKYFLFDFTTGVLKGQEKSLNVKKLSNSMAYDLPVSQLKKQYDLKKTGLAAELFIGDKQISRKIIVLDKEKTLDLPENKLEKLIAVKENRLEITIKSQYFSRLVKVESNCSVLPFSDNYFDILPGESITISQDMDKNLSAQEQAEGINVFCCTDIEPKGSGTSDFFKRISILLKPANFIGWIYNRRIPKEYTGKL